MALTVTITRSTYGALAAITAADATCTAKGTLPSGGPITSAALQVSHVALGDGSVSWTYQVGTNTKSGTGTHTVTCSSGGQTASASAQFSVP